MQDVKRMLDVVRGRVSPSALKDVVVSKPISVGDRHVVVLSAVSYGFAAGGGSGDGGKRAARGSGGGGGGGAKATPVAAVVVEGGKVRLERLGR